jgi:hypothetical protein
MVEIKRTANSRRRKMADHFTEQVAKKEALRSKGLRHKDETVWFGHDGHCRLGSRHSHAHRRCAGALD